ncbi:MAG: hypothetical protein ACREJY_06360 [Candidatus Rokuibacteriota bacterium]
MKRRPAFLLAILIYVTLDLSLAMMPGAFQFESSDSVETIQIGRARVAARVAVLPAAPRNALVWSQVPAESRDRWAPPDRVERHGPAVMTWSSRASRAPTSTSEDPH